MATAYSGGAWGRRHISRGFWESNGNHACDEAPENDGRSLNENGLLSLHLLLLPWGFIGEQVSLLLCSVFALNKLVRVFGSPFWLIFWESSKCWKNGVYSRKYGRVVRLGSKKVTSGAEISTSQAWWQESCVIYFVSSEKREIFVFFFSLWISNACLAQVLSLGVVGRAGLLPSCLYCHCKDQVSLDQARELFCEMASFIWSRLEIMFRKTIKFVKFMASWDVVGLLQIGFNLYSSS